MNTITPSVAPATDGERGSLVTSGPAYVMPGAGPGQFVPEAVHGFARREVVAVARQSEFGCRDRGELLDTLRGAATGLLAAGAGWRRGASLELRYVAHPRPGQPTRVRLFVTAKALGEHPEAVAREAETAVEHACAALPTGYRHVPVALDDPLPVLAPDATAVEVRKQEELLKPQLAMVPADYYYLAHPLPGDGSGWPQFGQLLANVQEPVVVSLLFAPTVLDATEGRLIEGVTTQLGFHAQPRQEQFLIGQMEQVPADASAAAAHPIWRSYQERLRHCLLARATVIGSPSAALSVARALATAVSIGRDERAGSSAVTQRPRDEESRRRAFHSAMFLDVVPWGGHSIWDREDAPWSLRRLPYLFGISEASMLALLPVPEEHGAPGFPLLKPARASHVRVREEAGPAIELGAFGHHGEADGGTAAVPLAALNRHTLVVGAPGSGKTTTVLSMLVRLWREHRIPFMAIEPTKTEYRSLLAVPGMEDLRVITLGRDDIAPMRLNPLQPPPGVRREAHLNAVMAVFRAALPLDPPLPQLLEDALERAYERAGWDYDTTPEDGKQAPTLRDLLDAYESGFDEHGYSGEVKDNLLAALRLRLRSLTRGTRGLLLDTVESVDFDELMSRPVVIELDEISDREDKAVLAAFLLDRIRASARARGSTRGNLRHVTVLEEAHRLLSRTGSNDQETPQSAAIRSFCDAIAELRALGEGFVISSQSPSALAEAAVANTGTRILHRLESNADREIVLADLDGSEVERAAAARLDAGTAIVRWPGLDELEFVHVRPADGVDSGRPVLDAEVMQRMDAESNAVRRLLPYRLCTRDVCQGGCDAARRGRGRATAREVGDDARRLWNEHGGGIDALDPIASLLAQESEGDTPLAYCSAVHLSLAGDAFAVRRHDIRAPLAAGIRAATKERT